MCLETAVLVLFECIFVKEVWGIMGLQANVLTMENDLTMTVLRRASNSTTKEQYMMIA